LDGSGIDDKNNIPMATALIAKMINIFILIWLILGGGRGIKGESHLWMFTVVMESQVIAFKQNLEILLYVEIFDP